MYLYHTYFVSKNILENCKTVLYGLRILPPQNIDPLKPYKDLKWHIFFPIWICLVRHVQYECTMGLIDWLIIYGITSWSRIFHLYGDVTIAGEGLQNLGLCSALRAFLYRATPTVTRDLGFSGLIRRTATFSRLLRHMRGCGGSILTRILTGAQWDEYQTSTLWSIIYSILLNRSEKLRSQFP
jgi:hypothetical protein